MVRVSFNQSINQSVSQSVIQLTKHGGSQILRRADLADTCKHEQGLLGRLSDSKSKRVYGILLMTQQYICIDVYVTITKVQGKTRVCEGAV